MAPRKIELNENENRILNMTTFEASSLSEDDKKLRKQLQSRIRQQNFRDRNKSARTRATTNQTVQQATNKAISVAEREVNKEVKPLKRELNIVKQNTKVLDSKLESQETKIQNIQKSVGGESLSTEKPLSINAKDDEILAFLPNRKRLDSEGNYSHEIKLDTYRLDKTNFERFMRDFPEANNKFYDYVSKNWEFVFEQSEALSKSNRQNYLRILGAIVANMEGANESLVRRMKQSFDEVVTGNKLSDKSKEKDINFSVPTLADFLQRVRDKYPDESKLPRLIIEMITQSPFRDNYKNMIYVTTEEDARADGSNYLLVDHKNKQAIPIVRKFKTERKYKFLTGKPITGSLFEALLKFIAERRTRPGEKVFPSNLNSIIKNALIEIGIRRPSGDGAFPINNFFRHLVVSNFLLFNPTPAARQMLADRMGHSTDQQARYQRIVDENYFQTKKPSNKKRKDLIKKKTK